MFKSESELDYQTSGFDCSYSQQFLTLIFTHYATNQIQKKQQSHSSE